MMPGPSEMPPPGPLPLPRLERRWQSDLRFDGIPLVADRLEMNVVIDHFDHKPRLHDARRSPLGPRGGNQPGRGDPVFDHAPNCPTAVPQLSAVPVGAYSAA